MQQKPHSSYVVWRIKIKARSLPLLVLSLTKIDAFVGIVTSKGL